MLPENCWFKLECLVTKSGWIIFELHNNCKLKLENPNEPLTKRTQTKLYSEQITPHAIRLWAVLSTSSLLHTFLITRTVRNNCKIAHEAWDMFTHFSSEPLCWYLLSAIVLYLWSRSKDPLFRQTVLNPGHIVIHAGLYRRDLNFQEIILTPERFHTCISLFLSVQLTVTACKPIGEYIKLNNMFQGKKNFARWFLGWFRSWVQ